MSLRYVFQCGCVSEESMVVKRKVVCIEHREGIKYKIKTCERCREEFNIKKRSGNRKFCETCLKYLYPYLYRKPTSRKPENKEKINFYEAIFYRPGTVFINLMYADYALMRKEDKHEDTKREVT